MANGLKDKMINILLKTLLFFGHKPVVSSKEGMHSCILKRPSVVDWAGDPSLGIKIYLLVAL